jgi:membrane-bound lytic murein transglycosylase D
VLGAYNGGEGAMGRLASRNPDASFWDPKIYFDLSAETRDYVPMVLAAAWLFLHPERYHLVFPKLDAKPAAIELAGPTSIDELTVCLGNEGNPNGWFRTLRNLNPSYEPQQAIAAGTRIELPAQLVATYKRDCMGGNWVELAADLHRASAPTAPAGTRLARNERTSRANSYVVKRGETLGAIARKVGCSDVSQIASANRLKAPAYLLRTGQRLHIPACSRR